MSLTNFTSKYSAWRWGPRVPYLTYPFTWGVGNEKFSHPILFRCTCATSFCGTGTLTTCLSYGILSGFNWRSFLAFWAIRPLIYPLSWSLHQARYSFWIFGSKRMNLEPLARASFANLRQVILYCLHPAHIPNH